MTVRALVACAAVLAGAAALAGCGLGDKAAHAERIVDSVSRARAQDTVVATYSASMRIVQIPGGALGGLGPAGSDAGLVDPTTLGFTPEVSAPVRLELDVARASVLDADPEHLGRPLLIFDDLLLFGLRRDAAPREARPWLTLDLRELDRGSAGLDPTTDSLLLVQGALNPVVLLDLAAGPLTGSVEQGERDELDGVPVRRYEANFDLDKVLRDTRRRDYDEHRRDDLRTVLGVLGLRSEVNRGEIWLDDDGLPRRFRLALGFEPIRGFRIEVRLGLDLHDYGVDYEAELPTPDQLVAVDTLVAFLRSVVPPEQAGLEETLLGTLP